MAQLDRLVAAASAGEVKRDRDLLGQHELLSRARVGHLREWFGRRRGHRCITSALLVVAMVA